MIKPPPPALPAPHLNMQENSYIFLLVFSFLSIVFLDALKPFMKPHAMLIVNAALIMWLPSSVCVSLWILRRSRLGISFALPFWNTNNTRAVVVQRGEFGTLLAFGHAWLMLSRLLGGQYSISFNFLVFV